MNDVPYKAVTLLSFHYNYQLNRLVSVLCRADAGDTLPVTFNYSKLPVIIPECETRRLTIPETSELAQWAHNMPRMFAAIADVAAMTHAFMKVSK